MKTGGSLALSACLVLASQTNAATNDSVLVASSEDRLRIDAGADFRIRQEIMDNLPGLPGGGPYAMTTTDRVKFRNQIRMRPRVWLAAECGPFRLYARLADEFREYPTLNTPRTERMYNFPDEVFLDNLYLDGSGLEVKWLRPIGIEKVDFRVGRQDLFERGHSIYGLDRIIVEGTPTDGSRSFYSDMVRTTLHFDETRRLDAFCLYDSGVSDIRWGTRESRGRSLNCLNMMDSNDLDEWGAGLIYSQEAFGGVLPFKLYSIFKRTTGHTKSSSSAGETWVSPKEITTLGVWMEPWLLENVWSLELEAAKQLGRIVEGNREAGGCMAYAELKYRPPLVKSFKPVLSTSVTYYSGDKHRTGDDDSDTAWDPMWARYTQDSEMLVYGSLYENCYWSNMISAKAKLAMTFGPHHGMYLYSGPMFAAVQDDLGTRDGDGSLFKGLLTAARYDFPIRLAPKGATGFDRIEVVAHVVGEIFNPGGYFESQKPAYFFRWQVDFRF